ncbi:MAG: hypothetical protein ACK5TU_02560, partial [Cyclobacteriaceae bacterium]
AETSGLEKKNQPLTKCFCNGAVTSYFKVLSSFNVWFRGTGSGFGKAPLQKHKRWLPYLWTNETVNITIDTFVI